MASAVLALACLTAVILMAFVPLAAIDRVEVAPTRHVSRDVATKQSTLLGAWTFTASAEQARTLLRALPAVRDAHVEIALPGTVRLVLIEREALGRWVAADGAEWFVDADGVIFPSVDGTAAPSLWVRDDRGAHSAGDRVDPALVAAALRLAALAPGDLRADARSLQSVVTSGSAGLVLRTGAGWEVRFGGADRFDEKLALARSFLRDNPQRRIDYVDVRSPDRIVYSPN